MIEPRVISNVLSEERFEEFKKSIIDQGAESGSKNEGWNRRELNATDLSNAIHTELTPLARELFNAPAALRSFNCGAWSSGVTHMGAHYDVNACTYSLNLSIHVGTESWPLYVNGQLFELEPNQAVISSGEEHVHGRGYMPDPENNEIINWFFFWVEPEHWFFSTDSWEERGKIKNAKFPEMQKRLEQYFLDNKIASEKELYL